MTCSQRGRMDAGKSRYRRIVSDLFLTLLWAAAVAMLGTFAMAARQAPEEFKQDVPDPGGKERGELESTQLQREDKAWMELYEESLK